MCVYYALFKCILGHTIFTGISLIHTVVSVYTLFNHIHAFECLYCTCVCIHDVYERKICNI